ASGAAALCAPRLWSAPYLSVDRTRLLGSTRKLHASPVVLHRKLFSVSFAGLLLRLDRAQHPACWFATSPERRSIATRSNRGESTPRRRPSGGGIGGSGTPADDHLGRDGLANVNHPAV